MRITLKTIVGILVMSFQFTVASNVQAAGGMVKGPNEVAPDRYVYYPGTEVLDKDEVRVIACGTGMPDQRRGQASASFLFEFGNGEKMIFDIGTGSMRNISLADDPLRATDQDFPQSLAHRPLR